MSRRLNLGLLIAGLLLCGAGLGLLSTVLPRGASAQTDEEELYEEEGLSEDEAALEEAQPVLDEVQPAQTEDPGEVPGPVTEGTPLEEETLPAALPEPVSAPAASPPVAVPDDGSGAPDAVPALAPAADGEPVASSPAMSEEEFLEEEAGISQEERIRGEEEPQPGYEVLGPDDEVYAGEEGVVSGGETMELETAMQEAEKIPSILTTLEECKRVALMNDKRVQVALKQIAYEKFKVQESERPFLPGLKGTWERQEGDAASTSGGPDTGFTTLKYGLEGQYELFSGGKLIYTLKQNKNNLEVAKKKYYAARQEIIFKTEKAYYTLVKSQMVFEVQADLSKAAESALTFSREAYRQGLNSYHEFLNVQSQTDQTYYQLLANQQEITLAELGLRQACGIGPNIGIQIDAVLTFTDFNFNYSLDECLELAFKNRPDLAVSELTTLSDLFGIKIALAEAYPKIVLTGTLGKNGQNQEGQPFELKDEWTAKVEAGWAIGANTSKYSYEKKKSPGTQVGGPTDNTKSSGTHKAELALFDKFENLSNVAKAQTQQATTEADLAELRDKVANEVEENYFNYQKAMTQVTASLSRIKFKEKDLEVNRAKHMMDEVPLSTVLTAEVTLGEERVTYVKALSDYYIAISGLFKAMGLAK